MDASTALKSYVDNFLVIDAPVLILGDLNDELIQSIHGGEPSPYQNFLDDAGNYRFLNEDFDQPGQPNDTNTFCSTSTCAGGSVFDYVLATRPLFGSYVEESVGRFDALLDAFPGYVNSTSDHLPVYARFDFTPEATASDEGDAPVAFALQAPFPNPFRTTTTMTYALPEPTPVRLEVFDALGRRVTVLEEGAKPAGTHTTRFAARDLTPGLYLVRLTAGDRTATRRLVYTP